MTASARKGAKDPSTYAAQPSRPKTIPPSAGVCVGLPGLFEGCGEPLEPLRRHSCADCTRKHTAARNPGQPIVAGTGRAVVVPANDNARAPSPHGKRKPAKHTVSDDDLPRRSGELTRTSGSIYEAKHGNDARVRVQCDRGCSYTIHRHRWANPKYRPEHCSHPDHRMKGIIQ